MPKGIAKNPIEKSRKLSKSLKGRPGGMLGKHHSEESKRKSSETHKRIGSGKWMKGKITSSTRFRGRKHTLETRKKMSEAKKGETSIPLEYRKASIKEFSPQNKEFRKLVSIGTLGIPKTEKQKRAMSECRKGIYPKNLEKYMFQKGMIPHNKVGGICKIKDCGRKFWAKGYCNKHYRQQVKMGGNPQNNKAKSGVK